MMPMRTIIVLVALGVYATPLAGQQTGDLGGRNLILNDGGAASTTKNIIRLTTPDATTLTSDYHLIFPPATPTVNGVLRVVSVVGTTAQLQWATAPVIDIPTVFMQDNPTTDAIRRVDSLNNLTPTGLGLYAFDAQGARTAATQTASGAYSVILGGQNNTASGSHSAVLGGRELTLSGTASAGFNASVNPMTVSANSAMVLGSANLWLANNTNVASELRFYEPQAAAGAFPDAATQYVAFKANVMGVNNNTYTLPAAIGAAGQVLQIATGATATDATLQWTTSGVPFVENANVFADNTAIVQLAATTMLRVTSNGAPATRNMTIANGTTDGQQLVIRVIGQAAGNGVRLTDAGGGNLQLSGNADLQNNDTITLIWDATSGIWIELSRRNN